MRTIFGRSLAIALWIASASIALRADEPAPGDSVARTPEAIAALVAQLGADDYYAREEAEKQLAGLGFEAFDALSEAEHSSDLEIAARAQFLLRLMRVEWSAPSDAPTVKRLLDDYQALDERDRLQRIVLLANLPGDEGVTALCRLVRFEHSLSLSRKAAAELLNRAPPDEGGWQRRSAAVEATIGNSPRPGAQWLRAELLGHRDPAAAAAAWSALVEQEFASLEQYPDETETDYVMLLLRKQVDALEQSGQTPAARDAMRRIIALDPGQNESLTRLIDWLSQQQAWELLDEVAARFASRFDHDPLLLYTLASAWRAQGDEGRANQVVARAQALYPDNQRSHTEVGFALQQRGWIDWAVFEYRKGIEIGPPGTPLTLRYQRMLAELLHDQERHREAAEILEPCIAAMLENARQGNVVMNEGREPHEVASRRLYFLSCQAAVDHQAAQQRDLLEEGLKQFPHDTEILIALFRMDDLPPPRRTRLTRQIREACDHLRKQMEEDPEFDWLYNQLAWLISNTEGDFKEAAALSQRSLELRPNEAGYLDTLARCYYALGDLDQAIKVQGQAVQLEPHTRQIAKQLDLLKAERAAKGSPKPGS